MVRRDETFEPGARSRGIFNKLTEDLLQGQAHPPPLSGQHEPMRCDKRRGHPASISLLITEVAHQTT